MKNAQPYKSNQDNLPVIAQEETATSTNDLVVLTTASAQHQSTASAQHQHSIRVRPTQFTK